eukprot:CAMPEP_0194142926 /NCGR_PEP_ID=MMETSP0152-20130528/12143_1 /TAXON_ID=1049557 /ORGANISM="Thalassiothrix antarctica, Strain L6-D1" /LENGTH=163 /DNA_ID=CAMNT_0038842101 /DNA_START=112 /DNA_END=603 /DNA_ORIENTATION=+
MVSGMTPLFFLLLLMPLQRIIAYSSQSRPAQSLSRRAFVTISASSIAFLGPNDKSKEAQAARYILNEETGDYDEVSDVKWQDAWKSRLDKAQSMSSNDVFMAARGAGNTNQKNLDGESLASKKRRAMSACRDENLIQKAGIRDPKECTSRILKGEVDFMLNIQ